MTTPSVHFTSKQRKIYCENPQVHLVFNHSNSFQLHVQLDAGHPYSINGASVRLSCLLPALQSSREVSNEDAYGATNQLVSVRHGLARRSLHFHDVFLICSHRRKRLLQSDLNLLSLNQNLIDLCTFV